MAFNDNQKSPRAAALGLSLLAASVLLALSGCKGGNTAHPSAAESKATNPYGWGVQTQYVDKAIQPGNDFYRYVNKGWLDTAKIPAGMSMMDSFVTVTLSAEQQMETLIQELQGKPLQPGSSEQHVVDLYRSYLDTQGRNQRGIEPLKGELDGILKAKDRGELAGRMGRIGYEPLFGLLPIVDWDNPSRYILGVEQAGLGLPGRDYYLNAGEPFVGYRAAYLAYIEGVLQRAGIDQAPQRAKAIFEFEAQLAKPQWSPEQLRDMRKRYHVMDLRHLQAYAPGFDWKAFLKEYGYADVDRLQITTDTSIKDMAAVYSKAPLDTLRSYAAFHYLNNHAPFLSEAWEAAHFDLYSRRLLGIGEQRSLEKRALGAVNGTAGEEMAKLYVGRYFPPAYKAKTEEMVGYILQSMQEHLRTLAWMDEPTRKEALAKLAQFHVKIGYPERWHDYGSVSVAKDDLLGNVARFQQWTRNDARARLAGPVRTWEFEHNPQEVNAYYNPEQNEIVFLAAILQPPFFNPEADPAVNFGSIGTVIGHEIGHGFDDQGSVYDGTGKLRNWWTESSSQQFKERTQRLVAQYNTYSPIPGLNVNGQLTLGENIGDLGGISMSYGAYQKYVAAKYPNAEPPVLDGFTGNQRFFLGYAQLWRNHMTDEVTRMLVLTNAHSPGEFRTNGVVRNFDPWYEAFGVKETDALFLPKAERVSIW